MRSFVEEKEAFLITLGYGEDRKLVGERIYSELPETEKSKYVKNLNDTSYSTYMKGREVLICNDSEFSAILQMEIYRELKKIEKHLKIIKYCSIFFVVLTIILIFTAYSFIS